MLHVLFISFSLYQNPVIKNLRALRGSSVVKNLPAMQETRVPTLGRQDPLEKKMATHSSCLENSMDKGAPWAHESAGLDMTEHAGTQA